MADDVRFKTWDSYFYPGTQTFINKAGIADAEALRKAEYRLATMRQDQLQRQPIAGKFDLAHLAAIHRHLFQDLYPWAGQIREVSIAKRSTNFAAPWTIREQASYLHQSLVAENLLRDRPKPLFVQHLAAHYATLNALHPFREGNGRATRIFLAQLAHQAGYYLDLQRFDQDKERWNRAAERSIPEKQGGRGDLSELTAFFTEALRPNRAVAFERALPEVALQEHPELAGAFAQLRSREAALLAEHPNNPQAREHFMRQAHSELVRKLDAGQIPGGARAEPARGPGVLQSDAAMRAHAATAALPRRDIDALARGKPLAAEQREALTREGLLDPVSGDVTPAGTIAASEYNMRHPQFSFRDYVKPPPEQQHKPERATPSPTRDDDLGR